MQACCSYFFFVICFGQPFSETGQLTSSHAYDFMCTFSRTKTRLWPHPDHCYGHARWPNAKQTHTLPWTSTTDWAVRLNPPNPPSVRACMCFCYVFHHFIWLLATSLQLSPLTYILCSYRTSRKEKETNLKTIASSESCSWVSLRRAMRCPLQSRRRVSLLHWQGETSWPGPRMEQERPELTSSLSWSTTADLYHRMGGSSEPPEPPQCTGLYVFLLCFPSFYMTASY